MTKVALELPEEVFSALRRSPDEFPRETRLAAAIDWCRGLGDLKRKIGCNHSLRP